MNCAKRCYLCIVKNRIKTIRNIFNMEAIGFKNFRRFENFPTMELGGVTLLVGGNNSGKSTVVKAALLMQHFLQTKAVDYLNSGSFFPLFSFDVDDAHIGVFKNALFNKSTEDIIEFSFQNEDFFYVVKVAGDKNEENQSHTFGRVIFIEIIDINQGIKYTCDYNSNRMIFSFGGKENPMIEAQLAQIKTQYAVRVKEFKELTEDLHSDPNTKLAQFERLKALEVVMKDTNEKMKSVEELLAKSKTIETYDLPLTISETRQNDFFVASLIRYFINFDESPILSTLDKRSKEYKQLEISKNALKSQRQFLENSIERINTAISVPLKYIYAHIARQETVYLASDRNDFMAQTLHSYKKQRIQTGDPEHEFVKRWMPKFEIGTDFEIKSIDAEAYTLDIIDEDGSKMPLGNKGMGSIQMMILLLQLASLMKQYRREKALKPVVMIEEPEQNLHPKLQSLLAELFYELNSDSSHNLRFLIETHSEYIVRKSQSIVALNKYASNEIMERENPFRVYYLPKGRDAYQMEYRIDGKFKQKFDSGFFDVSSELLFDIM